MTDRSKSDARSSSAQRQVQPHDDQQGFDDGDTDHAASPPGDRDGLAHAGDHSPPMAETLATRDALLLMLGQTLISASNHYHGMLYETVCTNPRHAANRRLLQNTHYKLLDTHEGLQLMLHLWRRSDFPHQDSFKLAGLEDSAVLKALNANAMGSVWFQDRRARKCSRTKHRYVAQVRALVEAGVAFGLIEVRSGRGKAKPLHATELCDQLVRTYLTQVLLEVSGVLPD